MNGFGIVGYGRIGRRLAERLAGERAAPPLVAVLRRNESLETFIGRKPGIVVESASRGWLAEHGVALLAAGIDLVPLSLTAFTDRAVEQSLLEAAERGPGRLEIAPGAMGTLDLLATAREAGLARVVYRQAKSPAMWALTPAAALTDLAAIRDRTVFLRGSVREVAGHFPQNLNTSVGVALAGLGLDRTEAELIADPELNETAHEIDIEAAAGDATLRLGGRPVGSGDPVDYTTFSLVRLLKRRLARVAI
jgi:aspartate dehydrogenase